MLHQVYEAQGMYWASGHVRKSRSLSSIHHAGPALIHASGYHHFAVKLPVYQPAFRSSKSGAACQPYCLIVQTAWVAAPHGSALMRS